MGCIENLIEEKVSDNVLLKAHELGLNQEHISLLLDLSTCLQELALVIYQEDCLSGYECSDINNTIPWNRKIVFLKDLTYGIDEKLLAKNSENLKVVLKNIDKSVAVKRTQYLNKDLVKIKAIDTTFFNLNSERKNLLKEFITYSLNNNSFNLAFNARSGSDIFAKLAPFEFLLAYLSPNYYSQEGRGVKPTDVMDISLPTNDSKYQLFETLLSLYPSISDKFIFDYKGIMNEYVIALNYSYLDKGKAFECLRNRLATFNRDFITDHLLDLYSVIDKERILWHLPMYHSKREYASIPDLVELLKIKPKSNLFYDLLNILMDTKFEINKNKDILTRLIEVDIKKDHFDYLKDFFYDYAYSPKIFDLKKKIKGFDKLNSKRFLEILSYDQVKTLDELIDCASLGIESYLPIKCIGEGSSRVVFKALDEDEIPFALKVYKLDGNIDSSNTYNLLKRKGGVESLVKDEKKAAVNLTHQNIARYYTNFIIENNRHVLVEEYIDGFSLEELVKNNGPLSKPKVVSLFKQVANGLSYMHEMSYVHRDIKPSNIMITKDMKYVKITDLQLAIYVGQDGFKELELNQDGWFTHGARTWTSPELIKDGVVSFESDIYSFGACLYYALTGEHPIPTMNLDIARDESKLKKIFTDLFYKIDNNLSLPHEPYEDHDNEYYNNVANFLKKCFESGMYHDNFVSEFNVAFDVSSYDK